MPKKRKTIAKLVDECAVILQKIVKIKAADENGMVKCVTCGKIDHWKEMDGGHWIPRTYTIHKITEENIHPQCRRCNRFRSGEGSAYTLFMIDTYGREFVDEMERTKRDIKKWTRPEIEEKLKSLREYESRVRQLKGF